MVGKGYGETVVRRMSEGLRNLRPTSSMMDDEEGICRGGTRHALSGVLSPSVYMGVDVVGTACEGSDNTVLGRCSSTGGLGVLVEIGVVWASDKQR